MPTCSLRVPRPRRAGPLARPLAIASLAAGLVACQPAGSASSASADGDDPIAALRASAPSTRYTSGYWQEQARRDPQGLWAQAIAYCGDDARPRTDIEADGAKPNCRAVQSAAFVLRQERANEAARARRDSAAAQPDRGKNAPSSLTF